MKNLIVTVSLVCIAGITQAFAHPAGNDPVKKQEFAKKFAGAENVKWISLADGYEKVAFTLGGTRAEAYFNSDGEFLGTVRNMLYTQLPLLVMQTVSNRFTDATIIEVREINNSEGTNYRVILEHKDKKYNVRLNTLGEITEQQKEKIKK